MKNKTPPERGASRSRYGIIGALVAASTTLGTMVGCSSANAPTGTSEPADLREGQVAEADGGTRKPKTPKRDGGAENSTVFGTVTEVSTVEPDGQICSATAAPMEKRGVDAVFIIDNSGSMSEEMVQVKANINSFASRIGAQELDVRVTVLTQRGDRRNSLCVPPPLGGLNCGDNAPTFRHIDTSIDSTNGLRRFLELVALGSISLREDAAKVFVVVTDDQSDLPAMVFDEQLLSPLMKGQFGTARSRGYVFHTIAGWQEGTPNLFPLACSTAVNNGSEYQKLSLLTGGIIESVCKTSYASVLDNIAKGIAERQACELALPKAGGQTDAQKVAVELQPKSGNPTRFTRVTDVSKCASIPDGWYFDDNEKPTRALLCQGACGAARESQGGVVRALMGCRTPPPR